MSISLIINRCFLNIYVIFSCLWGWIKREIFHKRYKSDAIMISCDAEPNLGDLLLGINLIIDVALFGKINNRSVFICCTSKNISFLKRLLGTVSEDVQFIPILPIDKKVQIHDLKIAKKQLKQYSFSSCINGFISFSVASNFACLTAKCNETLNVYPFGKQKANSLIILRRMLLKKLFSRTEYAPNKLRCNQVLAQMIGVENCQSRIYKLSAEHPRIRTIDSYITLTVDSSWTGRRWSMNNWAQLAKSLHSRYHTQIVLLGVNVDAVEFHNSFKEYETEDWLVNNVGKTTFEEMNDIISGSLFHVGIDSGSIHFAASLGTPAFCLTGYWDGDTYFPYDVSENTPNTVSPFVVRRKDISKEELLCAGCNSKWGLYGYNNEDCSKSIQSGETCECVQRIELSDVLSAIEIEYDNIIKELPNA